MAVTFRPLALAAAACALLAAAAPQALASERVGVASAVNQSAQSQRGGAGMRTIHIGANFVNREKIETGATGLVQVLLADGSNFVVGPNSTLVIDEFVYRPSEGGGRLVATFGRGVARYVGGRISKERGGVTINTRQGTIGVRGGMANLVDRGNEAIFSFLYGKDLTFTGRDGKTTRVYRPGFSIQASGGRGVSQRTPQALIASVNQILAGNRPSGKRPTGSQLAGFAAVNSTLPPSAEARYPAPILGQPASPTQLLDLSHANSVVLQATKQYCGYYCY
ncbi:FecR domain-containing protein [Stappia sp. TSB10P1A]|uniref:FecR family protein n=1 Tax=Stappia sp. TSB10P1A TaxID=2003585 RepID=UPI0016436B11|nr:FecR domain-containing protein [Stappia sp. TSB10P1A]